MSQQSLSAERALKRKRRNRRIFIPLAIVAAGVVVLVVAQNLAKEPEKKEAVRVAPLVNVVAVDSAPVQLTIQSQGTAAPRIETTIVSEVAGKLVEVSDVFVAGGLIIEGDLLVRIDPSDYRTAVKRAEAALAQAQAQLSQEQARADQARRDWSNLQRKADRAPDLVLRKPQLAEAQALVASAEADVAKARRDLERTAVRAPYSGLVMQKQADLGQYVVPGTALGVTASTRVAEIRLPITDREFRLLNLPSAGSVVEQTSVQLRSVSDPSRRWSGRIVRSEGVMDEQTRVHYLVAQVDDPYVRGAETSHAPLLFGDFLSASIDGRVFDDVVVIPRHLLREEDQVLVVDSDQKLRIREVEVLHTTPQQAYIRSGIARDEGLVTSALSAPVDGMEVRFEALGSEQESATESADLASVAARS